MELYVGNLPEGRCNHEQSNKKGARANDTKGIIRFALQVVQNELNESKLKDYQYVERAANP